MQTICGIYFYRDLKEDEIIYVGQSKDIYKRHRTHLIESTYYDQPINRVLQNDPSRYILEIKRRCSLDELDDLEIEYIKLLKPKFNFALGGANRYERKTSSKYTFWNTKKMHYINHANQSRNRPFRLYYKGWYVPCGYFEEWFTCELVWSLIKEEDN